MSNTQIKSDAQLEGESYGEAATTNYMTSEQSWKSDRWGETNQENEVWEREQAKKNIPGRIRGTCKGPGAGGSMVFSSNQKKACVTVCHQGWQEGMGITVLQTSVYVL